MALFVSLNAALSFGQPLEWDLYRFPFKGWAWWLMDDLKQSKEVHNVALLGSSLMVSAMTACDANYLNRCVNLTSYHRAAYLDHKLRTVFGGTFNTFNLATPGQMPSDSYLSLRAMVNCHNRPDVVIYGVFPRDFIDSTLAGPKDTEPFQYLRRFVNIDDVYAAVFRSPFDRLDWWLGRACYLYGASLDFKMALQDASTSLMARLVPAPYNNPPFTWWDRVRLLPNYLPGDVHARAVVAEPMDEAKAARTWQDNTKDYIQRYRSPDPHTYRTQLNFLKQIARFCKKERIELIVVNMPITIFNVGLLQPGIYTKYVQALKEEAIKEDFSFYDMHDFERYKISDFHDMVHLNNFGGRRFVDHLVEMLQLDSRAGSALAITGQQLERHKALATSPRNRTY